MVERLAERFARSQRRWLIVTGVTLVIALATALPQVDLLRASQSERAGLLDELAGAQEMASRLPLYEQRLAEETAKLAVLRERQVAEDDLARLRSWLVDAARDAGCQVRRIDLASPQRRAWLAEDDPLTTPSKADAKNAGATPFELETRAVALSVTGTTAEVLTLLRAIDADRRLMRTHSVELKPNGRNSRELQLDLTLWYFALARAAAAA